MTINNQQAYIDSLWDWGFLDGCFKHGIKVTDVDGLIERKGRFLIIEAKGRNAQVKDGQKIAFKALATTGLFTILIIWGERNKPEKYCLMDDRPGIAEIKCCDEAEIQFIVSTWFEQVDALPWPDRP